MPRVHGQRNEEDEIGAPTQVDVLGPKCCDIHAASYLDEYIVFSVNPLAHFYQGTHQVPRNVDTELRYGPAERTKECRGSRT